MVIVGVDPASIHCGYAVIRADGDLLEYVECGVLEARARDDRFDRLAVIGRDLCSLLDGLPAGTEMAMEEGFVAHKRGALTLGESRGVVILAAGLHRFPLHGYAPATVKLHAAGNGQAKKDAVARAVVREFGLKTTPSEDATDALAVALTHARLRRRVSNAESDHPGHAR